MAIIAELSLEVDSQNSLDMSIYFGRFLLHGYSRFQRAISVESPLGLVREEGCCGSLRSVYVAVHEIHLRWGFSHRFRSEYQEAAWADCYSLTLGL